jgi:probable phosphoglycerate mutase
VASSHLRRAAKTAEICATHLDVPHVTHPGVAERQYGSWQGQAIASLSGFTTFRQQCYANTELRPNPDAENTQEVRNRYIEALNTLALDNPNSHAILLVSHGDAIDCLVSNWTHPQYLKNGQFVIVEYRDGLLHVDDLPPQNLPTQSV